MLGACCQMLHQEDAEVHTGLGTLPFIDCMSQEVQQEQSLRLTTVELVGLLQMQTVQLPERECSNCVTSLCFLSLRRILPLKKCPCPVWQAVLGSLLDVVGCTTRRAFPYLRIRWRSAPLGTSANSSVAVDFLECL